MKLLECQLAIDDLDSFVSDLNAIGQRHGATVQAFDARYVADRRHIERAVELADRAIERGENVARNRAVEILLYAAGRRQIDRALAMGVDEGEQRAVVLVDGVTDARDDATDSDGDAADGGAAGSNEIAAAEAVTELEAFLERADAIGPDRQDAQTLCSFFEITDAERAATDAPLAALVRERVALLEVEK